MSSLFSDPPFPRGTTLLQGATIELDDSGLPVAGGEIVGQVKAFQDVVPGTGPAAIRNSNRLVYCIAARYTGSASINVGGADKGKWYVLDRRGPLTTFTTTAAATDITNGQTVGVLDEYLTVTVRPNDIVWLVVKGPAAAAKGNTVVVAGGLGVEIASGLTVKKSTQANMVGQAIDRVYVTTNTSNSATSQAVIAVADATGIVAGMPVTGTNVPTDAYVSSVSSLNVTISANITTQIDSGTTLSFGGALRTATSCRVNVHSNHI